MAKETFWFRHDADAADDDKTMLLIEQLGLEGYGIYWVLIEKLRVRDGYKMPFSVIPSLARRYMTTPEKMKTVITQYGLFQYDDEGFFYSTSLIDRMKKLDELKEKRSEAGRLGMTRRWEQKRITSEKQNNNNDITELQQSDNIVITNDNTTITSCNDKNRIDKNRIEYKEKEDNKLSSKKKAASNTWRLDFETYKELVDVAKGELLSDEEFKSKFLSMYPNADFYRSVLKSMDYWCSETGWETKKKSRGKDINMLLTLKKNLDKSVVYKNYKDEPIENLRKLSIEYADKKEGTLADGTIIKGAYRYYFSQKDSRTYSIPIDAPPMPNDRCEFNISTNSWSMPKESENLFDNIW